MEGARVRRKEARDHTCQSVSVAFTSMTTPTYRTESLRGSEGTITVQAWPNPGARHVVVISHGYGEHIGRYEHVARAVAARGASAWGPDHLGHGRSDGEPALVRNFEHVVDDLHGVIAMARAAHPDRPLVLIGHSMGGLIATRYAQRHGRGLRGLVLSAPAIGRVEAIEQLVALPEIPDVPIDPSVLSRDPAVQQAYARDPLVYHGPFKRLTLEALGAALTAVDRGAGFGALPTLWLHGADDELVPIAGVRAVLAKLHGPDFTARVYEGARHEVFNETNRDEVLDEVCQFIDRVTAR